VGFHNFGQVTYLMSGVNSESTVVMNF
jgi:hypothetical protein